MGSADGADPCTASVIRRISPFYSVMFVVLMRVTYIPELSFCLPRLVLRQPR
jgi:TRAP-type C4-dicarboxylate transport system permease large subunit